MKLKLKIRNFEPQMETNDVIIVCCHTVSYGRESFISIAKYASKLNSDHLSHRPASFILVWKYFSNVFAHL